MPPSTKRSYATANFNHGPSSACKRRRPIEIIVLSSDSESDVEELHEHDTPVVLDDNQHDEDEDKDEVQEHEEDEVEDNDEVENEEEDEEDEIEGEDEVEVDLNPDKDENESDDGKDKGPDMEEPHANDDPVVLDGNGKNDDVGNASQESQPRRSWDLIGQLQQDAFDDFKFDLRLELDELRPGCREDAANGLRDVLRPWVDQDKASRHSSHLYYRFDAKYSEDQFPPQEFRGRDQAIVDALGRLVTELPLEIFVALLDRDDSAADASYLVRRLADREGHDLVLDIPADEQSWVQTRLPSLKARAPDCEAAVMLVPRDSLVNFLMRYAEIPSSSLGRPTSMQSLQGFVTYFLDRISEQDNRSRLFPVFKELCVRVWQLDEAKGLAVLPEDMVNCILKAGVDTQDWVFLEEAASHLGGRPHMGFFHWVGGQVASGGLFLPPIEKSLLTAALTGTNSYDRALITHQFFHHRVPQKGCEEFLKQLIAHVPDDLSSHGSCSHVAHILVDQMWTIEGSEEVASKFVTIVEKNAAHTSFGLGILECLRLPSEDRPSSPSVPKDVYNQLAKLIIDELDVSKLFQRASRDWGPRGCACAGPVALTPGSSGAVDALQLANTFSGLLAKGADSLAARFATKIVADVGLIPRQAFASLWLPFLSSLLSVLEKHQVPPCFHHKVSSRISSSSNIPISVLFACACPCFREPAQLGARTTGSCQDQDGSCTPLGRFTKGQESACGSYRLDWR